ncbi:hypothetical protein GCM10017673_22050 [Streptosporangium violaceochromogenes]|nr:hypothetical protein GCM10017673_22050 [Streptosporangium violaceochromogenes]
MARRLQPAPTPFQEGAGRLSPRKGESIDADHNRPSSSGPVARLGDLHRARAAARLSPRPVRPRLTPRLFPGNGPFTGTVADSCLVRRGDITAQTGGIKVTWSGTAFAAPPRRTPEVTVTTGLFEAVLVEMSPLDTATVRVKRMAEQRWI